MSTVRIELTFEQIRDAIFKLPAEDQARLLAMMGVNQDSEVFRHRVKQAKAEIRAAYTHLPDEKPMRDADAASKKAQTKRRAKRR